MHFDPNKSISEQFDDDPFYVFPILADGKVTIDLTIGLQKRGLEVIGIGGGLNKVADEMSKKHGLKESRVVTFAPGDIFVIAKKNNENIAYSPYMKINYGI